jgi:hypothetical protein
MASYITPIYDRTKADIDAKTAKAYFNISDWLRIEANTAFVKSLVDAVLDTTIAQNTLTEPTITTFPTATEINEFLENIEVIRQTVGLPASFTPAIKITWQEGFGAVSPDYEDANLWEQVLTFIFIYLVKITDYRVYCGVSTVGQARFYQHRWRVYPWWDYPFDIVRTSRSGIATTGASLTRNNKFRSG